MSITLKTLQKTAPVYFEAVKECIDDLGMIRGFTGKMTALNQQMTSFLGISGMSVVDIMYGYDPGLLNYDGFKMMVIVYTSICAALGKDKISIPELRWTIQLISECVDENITNNDVLQHIINNADVDPEIVPANIKIDIAKEAEEKQGNELCYSMVGLMRLPNSGEDYNSYKEYVENQAVNITNALNKEGLVHSHSMDVFVSLLILNKMGVNIVKLYQIDRQLPIPKEVINELSKRIYENMASGNFGVIGGLDGAAG